MNYTDYNFYIINYKGELSEPSFNLLYNKAVMIIDNNVNREIVETDINFKFQMIMCYIIDLQNELKENTSNLQAISVDGVSKTYKSTADINDNYNKELKSALNNLPHELTRFL